MTEREEALEATNDRLAPVPWADGGKAIMGPDGTYWPFPLNGQAQQRWAAWCQKARLSLLSSSKAEGEMREAADAVCGELEKWLPTLSAHRSRQDCNRIRYVIANYRALSASKAEGEMREVLERIAEGEPNGLWAQREAIEALAALSKETNK
jgi:hypothetical protein